ncbi:MAG: hypothetical protein M3388_10890 [Acidobacteriota bacterium]|nr:hypothetical protein [Acidobacteriota bacterium]
MKITQVSNINKTQYELDFVDIDIAVDNSLFIDPYFLSQRNDYWAINASRTIKSFFQYIVTLISNGNLSEAKDLFSHLGEPNETCLGMSRGMPQGRGVGKKDSFRIFESLLDSKAVQTGLVEDLEDCKIFVDKVDKDKISDMTTNIIRKHLIDYTIQQCNLWQIPLQDGIPSGFFWNRDEGRWQNIYSKMLVIGYKKIILVPKSIVSYKQQYTAQKYHQHYILNFLQNEHLRMGSLLVQRRVRKNGSINEFVTKKDIKESEAPFSKEYLRTFTQKHPSVFENFKLDNKKKVRSISNEEIGATNLSQVTDHLINQLSNTPSGNKHATIYHRITVGILELLFYPNLTCPQIEQEIHEGRKRIDIAFDNAATNGFFFRLHTTYQTPSQFILVECKNYSSDLENPELDQIAGRFSLHKGKFGFIVCRKIDDLELFLSRCKDTYKDGRGVIIPLVDLDLVSLLSELKNGNNAVVEDFLSNRFRLIALN